MQSCKEHAWNRWNFQGEDFAKKMVDLNQGSWEVKSAEEVEFEEVYCQCEASNKTPKRNERRQDDEAKDDETNKEKFGKRRKQIARKGYVIKVWIRRDDLNLGDGGGISMISYRHKAAAATLIEIVFLQKMEEIKMLDEKAHEWLVERNPNSWCRSYFEMDRCSAAFENEISESFNSRILQARGKPIIIMLEGIMVYLMQRMWCMNKLAFDNKDSITPSVRRQMEYNKNIQMYRISL
ncbi:hypothetical protein Tco_1384567 [Tanacetum coccineum]